MINLLLATLLSTATVALSTTEVGMLATMSSQIQELQAEVAHLKENHVQDDEPGEIRLFGVDACPTGYEQVNATKGSLLMSKPTGGHALEKRILASAK
jgi:hypothetical protein